MFGTIGAIVFLGEKVRFRRMTALLVGFIGAMIILRPGSEPIGLGQACAIFNAISSGVMTVLLKRLSSEDDSGQDRLPDDDDDAAADAGAGAVRVADAGCGSTFPPFWRSV